VPGLEVCDRILELRAPILGGHRGQIEVHPRPAGCLPWTYSKVPPWWWDSLQLSIQRGCEFDRRAEGILCASRV